MLKKTTLLRALFAASICTSSFAASAASYTINFDNIASGSNANTDLVALANGVSFASAYLADTVDANFNVIGTHWAAYSLADLTNPVDPSIFAQNSANLGWGAAPSGANALDARYDQVMVQFANPTQLSSFSFDLDNTGYGNLQATNLLFLDGQGNTLFTSSNFYQATTTHFTQNFASAMTVSAVLLTSGKLYDNISVAAVPEPETYAMMLAGMSLLGFMAYRRRKM
jgi:hypothetical protein